MCYIGLLWATGLLLTNGTDAAAAETKSTADVVIYEGSYPGWPWITAGADGTFYCVLREGTEHGFSATGRILLSESRDQGKSWSQARVVIDDPGVDDRNVALTELKNGSLLMVYNSYTDTLKSQALGSFSADQGTTWSTPAPIGPEETRTRAAVVELSDGSLFLPFYQAPGDASLAARSTDGGKTWTTVTLQNLDGFTGDEWDALEVEPGRIIGIIRNNHPEGKGFFWMSESRDYGQTWSPPRKTNLQSDRYPSPAQIVLQNGKPTVIYPDRRMVSVAAAKTDDPAFLTWDVDNRLPCYQYNPDESPIADGSYLSSVPVGQNRRFLVDYEIRDASHRIAGYFVDFPAGW
jgi:Neuraminidase (sialidase)